MPFRFRFPFRFPSPFLLLPSLPILYYPILPAHIYDAAMPLTSVFAFALAFPALVFFLRFRLRLRLRFRLYLIFTLLFPSPFPPYSLPRIYHNLYGAKLSI